MNHNPFIHGNPVEPKDFFNRRQPLRRVVGRIVNGGQSTAIIGEPKTGKTSLLLYLAAPEKRAGLYGQAGERFVFAYLDAQTFDGQFNQAQFWQRVLAPFEEQLLIHAPRSPLNQTYQTCQENNFGAYVLERLLVQMAAEGWRLVVLLDEFNQILHNPILNSAEFFGSLRSLASRSRGALALVIASRHSLTSLNSATQEFSRTGSPYFNIFAEFCLGPFPESDAIALLNRADDRFTVWDKRAIRTLAGGHPFLLQVAAAAMWEAYEDGLTDMIERRRVVSACLHEENESFFLDTWRVWLPVTRKAFTTVALAHTAYLLPGRDFLTDAYLEGIRDFGPELNDLKTAGLLLPDTQIRGGWRVAPQAMLWWLADELVRAVRADTLFEDWLRAQELDHLLTKKEREQLGQAARGVVQVLQQGATTLVEAFAKGLGDSLTGAS